MHFQEIKVTGYCDNNNSVTICDKIAFIMCKNINMHFLSTSEREIKKNYKHEQKTVEGTN